MSSFKTFIIYVGLEDMSSLKNFIMYAALEDMSSFKTFIIYIGLEDMSSLKNYIMYVNTNSNSDMNDNSNAWSRHQCSVIIISFSLCDIVLSKHNIPKPFLNNVTYL